MFTPKELALERGWPGRVEGDRVIQLAAQTLQSFFTGGGSAREHAEYALADIDFRPPVLRPPSVRDFMAFEEHVANARRQRGSEVPEGVVRDPRLLLLEPARDLRRRRGRPVPRGHRGARLRARMRGGHRRRGQDRRLHRDERLVGARRAAAGDARRPRTREREGLRDIARPRARYAGRVRRHERDDDRPRERRGALARRARRDVPQMARAARAVGAQHRSSLPAT